MKILLAVGLMSKALKCDWISSNLSNKKIMKYPRLFWFTEIQTTISVPQMLKIYLQTKSTNWNRQISYPSFVSLGKFSVFHSLYIITIFLIYTTLKIASSLIRWLNSCVNMDPSRNLQNTRERPSKYDFCPSFTKKSKKIGCRIFPDFSTYANYFWTEVVYFY